MFLKSSLHNFIQNKFVRSVAVVVTGTAGAQFITMLFSPIITRIYGSEAFGLLGIFISLTTILSTVIALCYPIAITLPPDDAEANGLGWLSFYIGTGISVFITLIFLFWGDTILFIIGAREISQYGLLIPLFLVFSVSLQIFQQLLIRKKRFRIYAKGAVYQALIIGSMKIVIGFINPIAATLIIIYTFGTLLFTFILWLINNNDPEKINSENIPRLNKDQIKHLAIKFSDFPIYRSPQVLINSISQNLPLLLLANLFGPMFAGFYSLARNTIEQPIQLVSNSLANVFYPHASEAFNRNEDVTPLLIKSTAYLALVGILPFSLVVIFGPEIFSFVFGAEWEIAGEYARWLSVMLFFGFINRPSVVIVPIIRQQKILLLYEVFSTGIKILALYLGFSVFKSDKVAVALFGVSGAISYIALITGVFWATRRASYASGASR